MPGDTNGFYDIFVRDRATGTTERVSVDSNGGEANGYSYTPTISADGRFVAFWSLADTLVSGDTNGVSDVFVHDRATGATERVSVNTDGSETFGLYGSRYADISADGRFVVFASDATDLIADDTDDVEDIFVHDLVTGTTERVSVDASNPVISGDGRYVAFESFSDNLVPGGNNYELDVFVHDRETGTTEQVSVDTCGIQGDDRSNQPAISANGLVVAFTSEATNLVADDTNGVSDVFVRTRDVTASPPPGDTSEPARCVVDADSTRVEILDAVTGDPVNNLWFAPSFDPRQVIRLPDLNGNASAEVGVVLTKADEPDRVAIKDTLTGERVGTLMAWQPQQGFDLLQALPVPDADGNPTGKVALLLHEPATGKTLVRVTDATTNAQLAMVRGFNPGFDPVKLAAVSDLNGNGAEEYALLARNPDTGQVHAKVHDGATLRADQHPLVQQGLYPARHGQHRRHQRQRRRGAGDARALRNRCPAQGCRKGRQDRRDPEPAVLLSIHVAWMALRADRNSAGAHLDCAGRRAVNEHRAQCHPGSTGGPTTTGATQATGRNRSIEGRLAEVGLVRPVPRERTPG